MASQRTPQGPQAETTFSAPVPPVPPVPPVSLCGPSRPLVWIGLDYIEEAPEMEKVEGVGKNQLSQPSVKGQNWQGAGWTDVLYWQRFLCLG